MPSLDARLTALTDALQRRQMEQLAPVDPLSASLFDLQRDLASLDDVGKVQLLEALNNPNNGESGSLNLTMQDIERMVEEAKV